MLRTSVICCAVAGIVALAVVGCKPSPGTKPATKDEALKDMNAELEMLDKKVSQLKDKADKAAGDAKATLEAKWKDSAAKREAAAKKLEELKAAAADKWETIQKDADKLLDDAKKAVE